MRCALIVALTLVHALAAQAPGPEAKTGSICLATVKDDGDPRGYFSREFAVQVDNGQWVAVPDEHPTLISGLALEGRRLVRIRDGKKQIESFRFQFSNFDSLDLCLWYKPWYQTWSLWRAADAGRSCQCRGRDTKPDRRPIDKPSSKE